LTAGKTLFPLVVLDESDNGFFAYQSVAYDAVKIAGRERWNYADKPNGSRDDRAHVGSPIIPSGHIAWISTL